MQGWNGEGGPPLTALACRAVSKWNRIVFIDGHGEVDFSNPGNDRPVVGSVPQGLGREGQKCWGGGLRGQLFSEYAVRSTRSTL